MNHKTGYRESFRNVYLRRGETVSMRQIIREFDLAHHKFCRDRGIAPEGEWATNKTARDLHRSR